MVKTRDFGLVWVVKNDIAARGQTPVTNVAARQESVAPILAPNQEGTGTQALYARVEQPSFYQGLNKRPHF
jgi:2-phospho-L-lactate guanylyltransferase (CobY/MobA/RfbA family)